jgi:hypothetical protein
MAAPQRRISPIIQDIIKSKGYKVITTPWEDICKNSNADIHSAQEFNAVMKAAIAKAEEPYLLPKNTPIPPSKFKAIFQYAVLNNRGYPIDLVHAVTIGKQSNRYQAQIVKPLQASSTKIVVDDSVESRIHRFCQGYVDTQINPHSDVPYDVADINIIMSEALADIQEKHIDFEDYSNPELKNNPNFSVILPIEERASVCVWEDSHYAVDAAHQVGAKLVPPSLSFSEVSAILKEQGKEHLMEGIEMKEIFFGADQSFIFLDNTMHSGAPNYMNKRVYRLHFYVVRRNSIAPSKYTFFPSEIVWDLTRSGTHTLKLFHSDLKKNKKYAEALNIADDEDDEEAAKEPSKAKEPKEPSKPKKPATKRKDTSVANARESPKRKRGRPRKFAPDD